MPRIQFTHWITNFPCILYSCSESDIFLTIWMTSNQIAYLAWTSISRYNLFLILVQRAAPKVAIAPPVDTSGNPVQSRTCKRPGCDYFKRMENGILHDYCSRTCASKIVYNSKHYLPVVIVRTKKCIRLHHISQTLYPNHCIWPWNDSDCSSRTWTAIDELTHTTTYTVYFLQLQQVSPGYPWCS